MKKLYRITTYDVGCILHGLEGDIDMGYKTTYATRFTLPFKMFVATLLHDHVTVKLIA